MNRFSRHKGFTLVEMLIVIAVLVTLMSMMMLSSTEGGASADAAKIIADMATIKRAALQWYADNRQVLKAMYNLDKDNKSRRWNIQTSPDVLADIAKRVDFSGKLKLNGANKDGGLNIGSYGICNVGTRRSTWYVGYRFAPDESSVKEKIKGRAKLLGLHFTLDWPNPNSFDKNVKAGDTHVWMHVLGNLEDTTKWNPSW